MKQRKWPATVDQAVGVVIAAPRDTRDRFGLRQPGTPVYPAEVDFGHGDWAEQYGRMFRPD